MYGYIKKNLRRRLLEGGNKVEIFAVFCVETV
jgi:hypothetical protein